MKNNPDILFIVSPANADSAWMPFYFLYLAGYLEKCGLIAEIINPHEKTFQKNVDIILNEIKKKKPRFVGFAALVTDYHLIRYLADETKKISDSKIVVGNAQASIAPEDFLFDKSPFDIVVRGEGENTLKEIISLDDNNFNLSDIKGLAYFKNGKIQINDNREFMDLSDCGFPAYHKLDMSWYQKPTKFVIRRLAAVSAVIYTSRGCPFSCNFCASNSVWNVNKRTPQNPLVRKRPISTVIEELSLLQNKYKFDFFYILDDTFGMRESDILEFCQAYQKSELNMLWAATTRVTCINKEKIVKILKDSGCIQLDFGVETGSPNLLKVVDKRIELDQIRVAFKLCKKNKIRTFANILINLPGENIEDLLLTHKLLSEIRPTYVSIGITQPYPGTNIYKTLNKKIDKQDYYKFNREGLAPEEFRLAKHKLDLRKLIFYFRHKYGTYTPFEKSLFICNSIYWKKLFSSRRKWAYLHFLVINLIKMPLSYFKLLLFFIFKKHRS